MSSTSAGQKTTKTESKKTSTGKSSTSASKKGSGAHVKVPTARERAKDFDEGRRNDANSNEL